MVKKTNRLRAVLLISLMGIVLFANSPTETQAQYYNYPYNNYSTYNTQLYVTTDGTSFVTANSATLNGMVSGNTSNLSTWFEYGTTTNFGLSTAHFNYNYTNTNMSATVGSLSSDTVYYFRAVAQNTWGVVYGNTNSFRTNFSSYANVGDNYNIYNNPNTPVSLTAITRPATSVGTRSVDLNAHIVNTPGSPASTWFEWGTNYSLLNQTPIVAVGALPAVNHLSTITKLAPGTTYYFRAVVINNFTRSNGAILNFTTRNVAPTPEPSEPKVAPKDVIEETSPLIASAIGGTDFLPTNIFEWTILAILVAILIILARNIYVKK